MNSRWRGQGHSSLSKSARYGSLQKIRYSGSVAPQAAAGTPFQACPSGCFAPSHIPSDGLSPRSPPHRARARGLFFRKIHLYGFLKKSTHGRTAPRPRTPLHSTPLHCAPLHSTPHHCAGHHCTGRPRRRNFPSTKTTSLPWRAVGKRRPGRRIPRQEGKDYDEAGDKHGIEARGKIKYHKYIYLGLRYFFPFFPLKILIR